MEQQNKKETKINEIAEKMEKAEKISVSDLSIGDWVLDGNDNPAQILAIENWSDGHVLNVRIKDIGIGEVLITRVRPIPITQEILEKNGFVDNGKGQHYLKCGNGITVRVGRSPLFHDGCWLVATDKEVGETITTTCVLFNAKHIHEIQRVMQLGKVGKEITL